MDANSTLILSIVAFLIVIIALIGIGLYLFQKRAKFGVKIPGVIEAEFEGNNQENQPKDGIFLKDTKAEKGGLLIDENQVSTIEVDHVTVQDDIIISGNKPKSSSKKG